LTGATGAQGPAGPQGVKGDTGATGAPGVGFADAPVDSILYGRQDAAWARAVKQAGDLMVGNLTIKKIDPRLILDRTNTTAAAIYGQQSSKTRWTVVLGDNTAESTGNAGSNLVIDRYDDAGVIVGTALEIIRSTGDARFAGNVTPIVNGSKNLGSSTARWATVFTSDLSLSNGVGDWTIVEGEDDLFLYNNKRDKVYKFALIAVDPADAPPKKKEDGDGA
jgi:hypothetical protein